jgi:hypothetical protein
LMTLEPGVFCVFQTPSQTAPDGSGLPGVRLSSPPGLMLSDLQVEFAGFRPDGWVSEYNDAVLVRVLQTAQLLVTVYQHSGDRGRAPNLQVVRVGNLPPGTAAPAARMEALAAVRTDAVLPPAASSALAPQAGRMEVSAHIQSRGDVSGQLGAWMGEPGSGRWVEGFAVQAPEGIAVEDLEYQAVLGRGWLSPWVSAGEFCGSRGMALPILGLRLRLRGGGAEAWDVSVEASFVDGTRTGPLGSGEPVESPGLAPLEAFLVRLEPKADVAVVAPAPRFGFEPELQAEVVLAGDDGAAVSEGAKPRGARAAAPSRRRGR